MDQTTVEVTYKPVQGTPAGAFLAYVPEGVDGDAILLHPRAPKWVRVNRTARRIITRMTEPGGSAEAAAQDLAAAYGLAPEAARRDVAAVEADLVRHGFLGNSEDMEDKPRFGSLFLILTERCNLACAHCYGGYPDREEMPVARVLELIDELVAGGGTSITFSGGEPLLYPGLEQALERADPHLRIQLCTNGILMDARWAARLARLRDPLIQVSLDGPTCEIHDAVRGPHAFDGALRGIRRLQEAGLADKIVLAATIQAINKDHLMEMVHLAAGMGVSKLRFLPLRPEGTAKTTWDTTGDGMDTATYERIFDQFLNGTERLPRGLEVSCGLSGFTLNQAGGSAAGGLVCSVGRNLCVEASGEAYPCAALNRESMRLGNARTESLAAIIHGEAHARVHGIKQRRMHEIEACSRCLWRHFCQSGCMAIAENESGTVWARESICEYRQRAYARAFSSILAVPGPEA